MEIFGRETAFGFVGVVAFEESAVEIWYVAPFVEEVFVPTIFRKQGFTFVGLGVEDSEEKRF